MHQTTTRLRSQRFRNHFERRRCCGKIPCEFSRRGARTEGPTLSLQPLELDIQLSNGTLTALQSVVGGDGPNWRVTELTEGKINFMYAVQGPKGVACLKQYRPYVKSVGESFPLSLDRMEVEASALHQLHPLCPSHIPQLYHFDGATGCLVVEFLPSPHQKLLTGLAAGLRYPHLAQQLAHLMVQYLWTTSKYCLPQGEYQDAVQRYANASIKAANEDVVLVWPWGEHQSNSCIDQLEPLAAEVRADPIIQASVRELLQCYQENKECLIHNDLHTGNLLVTPTGSTYLIDWEFACYGPMAYDLGSLTANLLLSMFSLPAPHDRSDLCRVVEDFWRAFTTECTAIQSQQPPPSTPTARTPPCSIEALLKHDDSHMNNHNKTNGECTDNCTGGVNSNDHNRASTSGKVANTNDTALEHDVQLLHPPPLAELLSQAVGYAAVCMTRLLIGMHKHPGLHGIEDEAARARSQVAAARCAMHLLRGYRDVHDCSQLMNIVTMYTAEL